MDAMTRPCSTTAGASARRGSPRYPLLLAGLCLLAMTAAGAAEFEVLDSASIRAERIVLTRAPGRLIEKVVPDEGYQRVGEARPRLSAGPRAAPATAPAAAVVPAVAVVPLLPVELKPAPPAAAAEERIPIYEQPQRLPATAPAAAPVVADSSDEAAPAPDETAADQAPGVTAATTVSAAEREPPAAAQIVAQGAAPLLAESGSMHFETAIRDDRVARVEPPREPQQQAEADVALPRPADGEEPLLKLGPGDAVSVSVFGRPEFNTTTYVGNDGRISVPLAGAIAVAGLSPNDAALRVAYALREGQFLVNPQVTITLSQYRSQTVSVLGEVKAPGRFPIESRSSVFDLLAQAGGVLETGSDVVYLLRTENGQTVRHPVDLKTLTSGAPGDMPRFTLRGGDSIVVPRAEQYYVYGEVHTPNRYRLEPGTTVVQAIARSGGITPRGSDSRIEIKRKKANGKVVTIDADLNDPVQADDVIRVKERIF